MRTPPHAWYALRVTRDDDPATARDITAALDFSDNPDAVAWTVAALCRPLVSACQRDNRPLTELYRYKVEVFDIKDKRHTDPLMPPFEATYEQVMEAFSATYYTPTPVAGEVLPSVGRPDRRR